MDKLVQPRIKLGEILERIRTTLCEFFLVYPLGRYRRILQYVAVEKNALGCAFSIAIYSIRQSSLRVNQRILNPHTIRRARSDVQQLTQHVPSLVQVDVRAWQANSFTTLHILEKD